MKLNVISIFYCVWTNDAKNKYANEEFEKLLHRSNENR